METIRTPEKERALTEALHTRPSIAAACRKARISRNAYYEWAAADPAFADRMKAARDIGLDALEDALIDRGLKTDTTAAIFMLKSHRREVYGDRLDLTVRQIHERAERIAAELGLSVDDVLAEAEAIVAGTGARR